MTAKWVPSTISQSGGRGQRPLLDAALAHRAGSVDDDHLGAPAPPPFGSRRTCVDAHDGAHRSRRRVGTRLECLSRECRHGIPPLLRRSHQIRRSRCPARPSLVGSAGATSALDGVGPPWERCLAAWAATTMGSGGGPTRANATVMLSTPPALLAKSTRLRASARGSGAVPVASVLVTSAQVTPPAVSSTTVAAQKQPAWLRQASPSARRHIVGQIGAEPAGDRVRHAPSPRLSTPDAIRSAATESSPTAARPVRRRAAPIDAAVTDIPDVCRVLATIAPVKVHDGGCGFRPGHGDNGSSRAAATASPSL